MLQHYSYGPPNEDKVEPDVPVADVPGVHLDAFVIGDVASSTCLPHAGHARAYHIEIFDVFAVFWDFVFDDGSWADEAHFTFEDVDELRQFVEACLRRKAPLFVTRGSSFSLNSVSHWALACGSVAKRCFSFSSASTHMLRNL